MKGYPLEGISYVLTCHIKRNLRIEKLDCG